MSSHSLVRGMIEAVCAVVFTFMNAATFFCLVTTVDPLAMRRLQDDADGQDEEVHFKEPPTEMHNF
jgi:hypothetical protein